MASNRRCDEDEALLANGLSSPGSKSAGAVGRLLSELGMTAMLQSPLDTKFLVLQRLVRLFAFGSATVVMVPFLSSLGVSPSRIGLFMTLTLVGSIFITFGLTVVADSVGRRNVLVLGAVLMVSSGVIFSLASNYWILLAAAILGVISPNGNEIGPFRAIEDSIIAHLIPPITRSDIYAWSSLVGTLGTASGIIASGWFVQVLKAQPGWAAIDTYRAVFVVYGVAALFKLIFTLCLSARCELDGPSPPSGPPHETSPLLGNRDQEHDDHGHDRDHNGTAEPAQQRRPVSPPPKRQRKPLVPKISKESVVIFTTLACVFGLDSLGSGLAPIAWLMQFFRQKFDVTDGYIGSLFFVTSVVSALSNLAAPILARRVGNIRAMVFTHLPSAIALAALGFSPTVSIAIFLHVLRSTIMMMVVAPRNAFLAAMLLPHERTAVIGAINVVKTACFSIGPAVTGALVSKGLFWVAFLLAGSCKVIYDIALLTIFLRRESREDPAEGERPADAALPPRSTSTVAA